MTEKTDQNKQDGNMEQLRRLRDEQRKTVTRLVLAVRTITPQQAVTSLASRAA